LLTAKNNQETPKVIQRSKSERIRKLTPRECLRLQGFPENFKIVVSDTQAYKQAGNAMSVNVIKMVFGRVQKAKDKLFKLGA
ncbi:DNA cytosine methyltransferase, partial [uncultured Campylobacter sp.]|uniref:DNA cytosine methyltransferase n=1 Tax=uncultured Campylobacter sp. TaxID=218934 RepID=UPI00261243F6